MGRYTFSVTKIIEHFLPQIRERFGYVGVFADEQRMHCVTHQDNNPSAHLWEDDRSYWCHSGCGNVDALEVIRVWRPDLDQFQARVALAREIDSGSGTQVRRRVDRSHGLF